MSETFGLLALDLALTATGWLVLRAFGFEPSLRRPSWLGFALFTGWCATGLALTVVATLGASMRPLVVVAVMVGLGAVALVRAVQVPPKPGSDAIAGDWASRSLQALGTGAVVVALGSAMVRALYDGADTNWDSWAFWIAKARSIYYFGGLDAGAGGVTTYANPEYPPLVPIQHAVTFGFTGTGSAIYLPLQQVVLAAAFFGALAVLLRTRVAPGLLWPVLGLLACTPTLWHYFPSALADPVLAYCMALAAVAACLWWLDRDRRWWNLSALLLACAALVKSEGLLLAAVLAALLVLLALRAGSSRRDALILVAVPPLALVPWKLWLSANDQALGSAYYSWTTLLHPIALFERLDRLAYGLEAMVRMQLQPVDWMLLFPAALLCALLVLRVRTGLGVLAAGWLGLGFVGLAVVYWIGTLPVDWWVDTSVERILLSTGTTAGALLPLLLTEALAPREDQRQPPVSPL